MEFISLFLATLLVNNFVLANFLGLCPFMGVSKRSETAIGMSLATVFVLVLSTLISYALNYFVLEPLGIGFLRIIGFIVSIAALVGFVEIFLRYASPLLYQVLGIFLPLITTNCAVLGVALLVIQSEYDFWFSMVYSLAAGLGFSLVMIIFTFIREKLEGSNIPKAFRGNAIALITVGFMAVIFMGFKGLF